MKKYLNKIISLGLAMMLMLLYFTACTGTGTKESKTSTSTKVGSTSTSSKIVSATAENNEKLGEVIITEDEKQGNLATGKLGASGDQVDTYSGYLGYGYNILTSPYYNYLEVHTSHPIIDMNSLAKDKKVYENKTNSSSVLGKSFISSSFKEYSTSLAVSANVEVNGAFSGNFEAGFGLKRNTQMKSNQQLITTQALLIKQNEYIMDSSAKLLADHATMTFKQEVDSLTAEALITKYGTHVLTNINLGGRFDLNYFYTSATSSVAKSLNESVAASYRFVSGSVSDEDKESKKEVENHSTLSVRVSGGSVKVNPTSIEAAVASYKDWSADVDDGKVAFIDASEVIPIWDVIAALDIVDPTAKSDAVKKYFDDNADKISGEFKDTIDIIPPVLQEKYISNIYIGYGKSSDEAKNMLRNQSVIEGNILKIDLNKEAGGYFIYLGYKTTTNKSNAITNIVADYYSNSKSSDINYKSISYKIIPVDLNKGAKGNFIYLYYTNNTKAGNPLTTIAYQDNKKFKGVTNADGLSAVRCVTDNEAMNFNKDAGGDNIYLWFKRG